MSRIRQRDTAPELSVRKVAYAMGLRYTTKNRDLPGSPDLANRSKKWAIFVHGCYWHRHVRCSRTTTPKTNQGFWLAKFVRNVERDAQASSALKKRGYRVAVIWECHARNRLTPWNLEEAFRGELVPRDPNDEPAGEMLERLRAARSSRAIRELAARGSSRASII
jgi:DNA mismatch endonuclease (patch repair protein)